MMRIEAWKKVNNGEIKKGRAVFHPIYGAGNVIGAAAKGFVYVALSNPRSDDFEILAFSGRLLGVPETTNRKDA